MNLPYVKGNASGFLLSLGDQQLRYHREAWVDNKYSVVICTTVPPPRRVVNHRPVIYYNQWETISLAYRGPIRLGTNRYRNGIYSADFWTAHMRRVARPRLIPVTPYHPEGWFIIIIRGVRNIDLNSTFRLQIWRSSLSLALSME